MQGSAIQVVKDLSDVPQRASALAQLRQVAKSVFSRQPKRQHITTVAISPASALVAHFRQGGNEPELQLSQSPLLAFGMSADSPGMQALVSLVEANPSKLGFSPIASAVRGMKTPYGRVVD